MGKTANGHISATRHPIDFMFVSMVGFSGTARQSAKNFKWPNL